MSVAEERLLELGIGTIEGLVVPVEAAATFGGAHEQRHEHAAIERTRLVGRDTFVCAREDPRRRLALQVVHRRAHVVARVETVDARFDEAADERAVLVERRAAVRAVLLEGEREVGARVEIAVEGGEGAEAESAQRVV